jgi:serine/threonine-protein kinase
MLDVASIRAAFPEMSNLVGLSESGQKDVLRGEFQGHAAVLKLVRKTPDAAAKIEREIEAAAQLACDYVPTLYSRGQRDIDGEPRYFLIEQYIDGETLRERLSREPVQPLREVLRLARVLLCACVDFETCGFVHRDIKPENILVENSGKYWVIDFGIVRFLGLESLTPTVAQWGRFTLGYGSPEQMGNVKPQIDARTDLFAVGVVLYETLYGQNPFYEGKRDQIEVIQHMTRRDLAPLDIMGDRAGRFSDFIQSLVSRFPSRRPQTAREALSWFEEIEVDRVDEDPS